MLDRIQAKLSRSRSRSRPVPANSSMATENAYLSSPPYETTSRESSPIILEDSSTDSETNSEEEEPQQLPAPTTSPQLTRTNSNISTSTASTVLPSYSSVSNLSSPPRYTRNKFQPRSQTQESTTHSNTYTHATIISPDSSFSTTIPGTPDILSNPSLSPLSFGISTFSLSLNFNPDAKRPRRPTPKRIVPLDHPVHDMSGAEQASLRRRGLDPVVVAEMRALTRMGRRRGGGGGRRIS